jgi:hypothetical protein
MMLFQLQGLVLKLKKQLRECIAEKTRDSMKP